MQNIQTGIRHYVGKSSEVILQSDLNKQNPLDQELFKSPKALAFPPYGRFPVFSDILFLVMEVLKLSRTKQVYLSSRITVLWLSGICAKSLESIRLITW